MRPATRRRAMSLLAAALLLGAGNALASELPGAAPADAGDPTRQAILSSDGFLSHHPDLRHRMQGTRAFEDGLYNDALSHFRRAARHADKPSQAMIAEMYFTGNGVDRDRALGYAWMDLAAERAYPAFLALREHYWAQLTDAERERAIAVGQDIYAEYEDAVARPRLERELRRGRRGTTGSRVGSVGNLVIELPDGPGGVPMRVQGSQFYDRRYWEPAEYWAWQDEVWGAPLRGRVEVLPLRQAGDEARGETATPDRQDPPQR